MASISGPSSPLFIDATRTHAIRRQSHAALIPSAIMLKGYLHKTRGDLHRDASPQVSFTFCGRLTVKSFLFVATFRRYLCGSMREYLIPSKWTVARTTHLANDIGFR